MVNDSAVIELGYVQMLYASSKVKAERWMLKKEDVDPVRQQWGEQYGRLPIIISKIGLWKEH